MAVRKDHRSWQPADIAALIAMRQEGLTVAVIADRLGRSIQSVNNRIGMMLEQGALTPYHSREGARRVYQSQAERLAISPGVVVQPTAEVAPQGPTLAEVLVPMDQAPEDETAFLARILHTADRSVAKAVAQRWATIRIASDEPVAVSLSSDWHVAPHGTDVRGLLEYADLVRTTPRLYALAVGDLSDNPIKHKGGNVGQVADELRLLDVLVGRFHGKLLGMTSGNHDDWSKTLAGVDNLAALARRHRIHYAPDELLWRIEIVSPHDPADITAIYHVYTRHQWRRGSALNPGHACWTWYQEESANWPVVPDVLAIGHNHVSVVESRQFAERDMWALRIGTWQIDSPYARAKGFARYRSTCPTVVMPPVQGRVQCFADPDAATQFMAGYVTTPTAGDRDAPA
jgi:hypothetical protein